MDKEDNIFLEHILDSIGKIEKYVDGLSIHNFVENEMVQDAVIRNFEVIGEATKKLSKDFRNRNTQIPWKKIAGMRDVLIHDYLGVDIYSVWDTIEMELPTLKKQIEVLVNT